MLSRHQLLLALHRLLHCRAPTGQRPHQPPELVRGANSCHRANNMQGATPATPKYNHRGYCRYTVPGMGEWLHGLRLFSLAMNGYDLAAGKAIVEKNWQLLKDAGCA